jgi:hypothetical protein
MNTIFGGDLVDGLFFVQDLQRDLCLLGGGKVFSFGHGDPSLHLIFALFRVQILLAT